MKRILIALAVLAFSAGLMGLAKADGWKMTGHAVTFKHHISASASADSGSMTIIAGESDTTSWTDLRRFTFANVEDTLTTTHPVTFQFVWNDAAADSSRIDIQACARPKTSIDGTDHNLSTVASFDAIGEVITIARSWNGFPAGMRQPWIRAIYKNGAVTDGTDAVRTVRARIFVVEAP